METIETRLKNLILSKYKSVLDFTKSIGMPYSTMDSIFKRGLGNANVTNVIKICKALGISSDGLGQGKIIFVDDVSNNSTKTVISIGRGSERKVYEISDEDADLVNAFIEKMAKKNN